MQRTWVVRADPNTGVVHRDDLIGALVDAAAVLDRIGGVLAVVQQRLETGFPGEMASVAVIIEWRDRSHAKPQPEEQVDYLGAGAQAPAEPRSDDPTPEELEAQLAAGGELAEPDEAEDDTAIPAAMR